MDAALGKVWGGSERYFFFLNLISAFHLQCKFWKGSLFSSLKLRTLLSPVLWDFQ